MAECVEIGKEGNRGSTQSKREFKGLREQMANCTRVSQPGSKSVLCIRKGARVWGGAEEGGVGVGGVWSISWGSAIRP